MMKRIAAIIPSMSGPSVFPAIGPSTGAGARQDRGYADRAGGGQAENAVRPGPRWPRPATGLGAARAAAVTGRRPMQTPTPRRSRARAAPPRPAGRALAARAPPAAGSRPPPGRPGPGHRARPRRTAGSRATIAAAAPLLAQSTSTRPRCAEATTLASTKSGAAGPPAARRSRSAVQLGLESGQRPAAAGQRRGRVQHAPGRVDLRARAAVRQVVPRPAGALWAAASLQLADAHPAGAGRRPARRPPPLAAGYAGHKLGDQQSCPSSADTGSATAHRLAGKRASETKRRRSATPAAPEAGRAAGQISATPGAAVPAAHPVHAQVQLGGRADRHAVAPFQVRGQRSSDVRVHICRRKAASGARNLIPPGLGARHPGPWLSCSSSRPRPVTGARNRPARRPGQRRADRTARACATCSALTVARRRASTSATAAKITAAAAAPRSVREMVSRLAIPRIDRAVQVAAADQGVDQLAGGLLGDAELPDDLAELSAVAGAGREHVAAVARHVIAARLRQGGHGGPRIGPAGPGAAVPGRPPFRIARVP